MVTKDGEDQEALPDVETTGLSNSNEAMLLGITLDVGCVLTGWCNRQAAQK